MYVQKIATILMDDEIHDILNEGNELGFQEYIFVDVVDDLEELINQLTLKITTTLENAFYLKETIKEIKSAIILLENKDIEEVVFVYQN